MTDPDLAIAEQRLTEMLERVNNIHRMAIRIATGPIPTVRCPFCQDFSLTYDHWLHQYTCHKYNATFDAIEFG